MLCLFRNSKIHPKLDKYAILASLMSVFAWLYFAFIEKALMSKLLEGKALIVDLVFGLPLVLALAVVVYATVYWTLKIILIYLLPQAIIHHDENLVPELTPEEIAELEAKFGKEYWNNADFQQSMEEIAQQNNSTNKNVNQNTIDENELNVSGNQDSSKTPINNKPADKF